MIEFAMLLGKLKVKVRAIFVIDASMHAPTMTTSKHACTSDDDIQACICTSDDDRNPYMAVLVTDYHSSVVTCDED